MPQGYMIGAGETLTVSVCSPTGHSAATVEIPVKGKHDRKAAEAATCPYSSLGQAALFGADPVLLALAIAFVMALGFSHCHAPLLRQRPRLRPPLRGPPRFT